MSLGSQCSWNTNRRTTESTIQRPFLEVQTTKMNCKESLLSNLLHICWFIFWAHLPMRSFCLRYPSWLFSLFNFSHISQLNLSSASYKICPLIPVTVTEWLFSDLRPFQRTSSPIDWCSGEPRNWMQNSLCAVIYACFPDKSGHMSHEILKWVCDFKRLRTTALHQCFSNIKWTHKPSTFIYNEDSNSVALGWGLVLLVLGPAMVARPRIFPVCTFLHTLACSLCPWSRLQVSGQQGYCWHFLALPPQSGLIEK